MADLGMSSSDFSRAAYVDTPVMGKSGFGEPPALGNIVERMRNSVLVTPEVRMRRILPAPTIYAILVDQDRGWIVGEFDLKIGSGPWFRAFPHIYNTPCQTPALPGVSPVAFVERDVHVSVAVTFWMDGR